MTFNLSYYFHKYFVYVLLIGLIIFQFYIYNNLSQEKENLETEIIEAENMKYSAESYLEFIGEDCDSNGFEGLSSCFDEIVEKSKEKPAIDSTGFGNYMPPTIPEGRLVLKNNDQRTFSPDKFKLYLNREIQDDDGCSVGFPIEPGYSCKLNFYEKCTSGDILEATYMGEVVYVYHC